MILALEYLQLKFASAYGLLALLHDAISIIYDGVIRPLSDLAATSRRKVQGWIGCTLDWAAANKES